MSGLGSVSLSLPGLTCVGSMGAWRESVNQPAWCGSYLCRQLQSRKAKQSTQALVSFPGFTWSVSTWRVVSWLWMGVGAYVLHAAPNLEQMAEATCALRLWASVCVGVEESFGEPWCSFACVSGGRWQPVGPEVNLWASCRSPSQVPRLDICTESHRYTAMPCSWAWRTGEVFQTQIPLTQISYGSRIFFFHPTVCFFFFKPRGFENVLLHHKAFPFDSGATHSSHFWNWLIRLESLRNSEAANTSQAGRQEVADWRLPLLDLMEPEVSISY